MIALSGQTEIGLTVSLQHRYSRKESVLNPPFVFLKSIFSHRATETQRKSHICASVTLWLTRGLRRSKQKECDTPCREWDDNVSKGRGIMGNYWLSKLKIMDGLQCEKRLWMEMPQREE